MYKQYDFEIKQIFVYKITIYSNKILIKIKETV